MDKKMVQPLKKALTRMVENSKMFDVHELPKEKKPKDSCSPMSESDYYWVPQLDLTEKDFPGVEKWNAGDTVHLAITATVKSVRKETVGIAGKKPEDKTRASIELVAISDITSIK